MKLSEAIDLLERENRRSYPKRRLEAHIALKLGIEALRQIVKARSWGQPLRCGLLPSETKEDS